MMLTFCAVPVPDNLLSKSVCQAPTPYFVLSNSSMETSAVFSVSRSHETAHPLDKLTVLWLCGSVYHVRIGYLDFDFVPTMCFSAVCIAGPVPSRYELAEPTDPSKTPVRQ